MWLKVRLKKTSFKVNRKSLKKNHWKEPLSLHIYYNVGVEDGVNIP